jgi:phosphopantothenoylcysteine decarboxylase/phosphopantothenate--cysteine ligase
MSEVLFQLSGSIAAYKACQVVSRLVQAGHAVQTAATRSALEFVGRATLEGLTGRPVATDTFTAGSMMDHIHLVRRADLLVLCPATANTINRLAAGVGDDLIGTMFLAFDFRVPYVVVPAMNAAMYEHPATVASIQRLRHWGLEFVEPSAGSLACGEIGPGRLAEPDDILAELLSRLGRSANLTTSGITEAPRRRVLITAGGTRVPIDGVRSITNTSTGRTGAALAAHFARAGYDVTLLHAADAVTPEPGSSIISRAFTTFDELSTALAELLRGGRFDVVIHLAAVSDYDLDQIVVDGRAVPVDTGGKLDTGESMEIHLKRTPKLLAQLKQLGGDHLVVVGFKLTNGASPERRDAAVRATIDGIDLVVHNDLTEMGEGHHATTLYGPGPHGDIGVVATADYNAELADVLEREIGKLLDSR